jgi:trimethylamine---corrinoid protein Co-methyltransferase
MTLALIPAISRPDIERIHARSLQILENVGVEYKTPHALQVLEAHGCRVDYERNWASLPSGLVEWALQQAPRIIRLEARNPAQDVVLDGRHTHHTSDSQANLAIQLESGERRRSTLEDLRRGCLFADALDMLEIVNVMVAAGDVPTHQRIVQHFATAFETTGKHVRTGIQTPEQVPFIVELAQAACGGEFRPIFSAIDCTVSPLMHDGPMTEACIELAKMGIPIMIYPMPLAGGTAPVTLAGTILIHNIEFLSGLVLFQAVHPGTPVIYGTGSSQLDMQTGRYGGSADSYAFGPALSALAHYYHLPVNLYGLSTSSDHLDPQYGHEATAACMLAYLSGADEAYSMGLLSAARALSLEKMVLDNHLARQIRRMLQPLNFDEAHLGAELIERVGIGGHFLAERETRHFTRQEYVPKWPSAGQDVRSLAREEALHILHTHQPAPLPSGCEATFRHILMEADQTLSNGRTRTATQSLS